MLVKKYTTNPKYNNFSKGHPAEDSCLASDKYPIGVIADGVTILDRPNGIYPIFSDGQSGPKKVSDAFCQQVLFWLEQQYPLVEPEIILKAFQKGNKEVQRLNQELLKIGPNDQNYGVQAFATVAAAACLKNSQLIYGFLTDCGIAVVGRNAQLKFITPEIWSRIKKPSSKHLQAILKRGKGDYRNFRNYVRNNPALVEEGKFYTYGVINGQEGAIKYVEVGQKGLDQKDRVIVFTDGFRSYFQEKDFLKVLAKDDLSEFKSELDSLGSVLAKKGKEYRAERTLILLQE